jgi:hypothetical protein
VRDAPLERWRARADHDPVRLAAAFAATLALALPAAARAGALLPPHGRVFAGVTGGYDTVDFQRQTGRHPAVFQFFSGWGQPLEYMFRGATAARARLAIHVDTRNSSGREQITPKGIATGHGDGYLMSLGARIAAGGEPVYIRLMAEMDGSWNAYCAYTASGRPKGGAHTTAWYRQAWRRTVLIVRGGSVATIDARLRALHLPPVRTGQSDLPRAHVAFLWVPQVAGSPDVPGNAPRAYWPGRRYVDWVGTDFYSKFPNFAGLERFYSEFRGKPFAFAEWAMWGGDDPGFVTRLFGWVRSHRRVRMMLYNQGKDDPGLFRLRHYPRARAALRRELRSSRFDQFAAEYKR